MKRILVLLGICAAAIAGEPNGPVFVRSGTNAAALAAPRSPFQNPITRETAPVVGSTFSRPASTFATPPGSFSRPAPAGSQPSSQLLRSPQPEASPQALRAHGRGRYIHPRHSRVTVVQGTYPVYWVVPVEVPVVVEEAGYDGSTTVPEDTAATAQTSTSSEPATPTEAAAPPVVIDLPPGARVINKAPATSPGGGR